MQGFIQKFFLGGGSCAKKKFCPCGCAAGRFLFYALRGGGLDWLKPTLTKKKFFEKWCFFSAGGTKANICGGVLPLATICGV